MSFLIFSLLALSVAGAAATVTTPCTGKILSNETLTSPNGVQFHITTTTGCSSTTSTGVRTRDAFNLDNLKAVIAKRDPVECTDPNSTCVCGIQCDATVCEGSPAGTVLPADCTALTNAILNTFTGTTFLVAPGASQTANFGTCEYVFFNALGEVTLEYCWDDFATTAHSLSLVCAARQAICASFGADFSVKFA